MVSSRSSILGSISIRTTLLIKSIRYTKNKGVYTQMYLQVHINTHPQRNSRTYFVLSCSACMQVCLCVCRGVYKNDVTVSTGWAPETGRPSKVPATPGGGLYEHPQLSLPQTREQPPNLCRPRPLPHPQQHRGKRRGKHAPEQLGIMSPLVRVCCWKIRTK